MGRASSPSGSAGRARSPSYMTHQSTSDEALVRRALRARGSHAGVRTPSKTTFKGESKYEIIGFLAAEAESGLFIPSNARGVPFLPRRTYPREAAGGRLAGDGAPAFDATLALLVPTIFPFGRPAAVRSLVPAGPLLVVCGRKSPTIRPNLRRPGQAVSGTGKAAMRGSGERTKVSEASNVIIASPSPLGVRRGRTFAPNQPKPPIRRV